MIKEILASSAYDVRRNGEIWTTNLRNGWPGKRWRRCKLHPTTGSKYLRLAYKDQFVFVHRLVYRKFHGPLRRSKQVDHKDGNRQNNRASNLQQLTPRQNIRKYWDAKTHCKRGHELTGENVYSRPDRKASRLCRMCQRLREIKNRN